MRTEIGLTNTNYSEISSAYPIADGYWHNNLFGINKDTYSYATVDSNAITNQSMSTIGKHIMSQPFLVGKVWVGYMKGQLSYLQAYRFENINQSTFLTSSQGLQFPVGGGAEEVLRLTFQDPRSVAGMLKDYSPKNHNVIPSGGIDLTNRVRTYYAITGSGTSSSYIPIESASNKTMWLEPSKISGEQWIENVNTYTFSSNVNPIPTSSLNSIGVYTPSNTQFVFSYPATVATVIPANSSWSLFGVIKSSAGPVMTKYDTDTDNLFMLDISSAVLRVYIRNAAGTALTVNTAAITAWTTVAITYDNSTKTLKSYLGGNTYTSSNGSYTQDAVSYKSGNKLLFLNGQSSSDYTSPPATIGSIGTDTGIAEVVVTSDLKSNSDINGIAGYLANKYGLTWTNI